MSARTYIFASLLTICSAPAFAWQGQDSSGTYNWSKSNAPANDPDRPAYRYRDISLTPGVVSVPWNNGDEAFALSSLSLNLPAFDFYGATYTDLLIDGNGLLIFGPTRGTTTTNSPSAIPNAAAPNGLLVGLWENLSPHVYFSGKVYALVDGPITMVQFTEVPRFFYCDAFYCYFGDATTFQFELNSDTGEMWISWAAVSAPGFTSLYTTVGIESPNGTQGHQFLSTTSTAAIAALNGTTLHYQPTSYCADRDGDGFTTCQNDCNDNDPSIRPNATELCDGIDSNCNGQPDDGLLFAAYYEDKDGDNYGNALINSTCAAVAPAGTTFTNGDCNDDDPAVKPGATEVCNATDDDCDSFVDEGLALNTYYPDSDGDRFGTQEADAVPLLSCVALAPDGYSATNDDCNDSVASINPDAPETCNALDDNCNGEIDEGDLIQSWYTDNDGDGYGSNATAPIESCNPILGRAPRSGDCDDTRASSNPGAPEVCDSRDNDCDSQIDEGLPRTTYYADVDRDGYGDHDSVPGVSTCLPLVAGQVTNASDCDDSDLNIAPNRPERCNGLDDNCDDTIPANEADQDNDGVRICENDCDDTNPLALPGGTEVCDGADNDCDGALSLGEVDADGDGFFVCSGDCQDLLGDVYPGAEEQCNGRDDNCDNNADEGVVVPIFYLDGDNDGHGDPLAATQQQCEPDPGYVSLGDDCDDNNELIFPAEADPAYELQYNIDANCDGIIGYPLDTGDTDETGSMETGDTDETGAPDTADTSETDTDTDTDADSDTDADADSDTDADSDADSAREVPQFDAEAIRATGSGCTCNTTGSPSFGWLVLPLLVLLRRRDA